MSGSNQAVFMNQRSFGTPPGSQSFTTAGTFTWVAPAGVTKVSVVVVGGGEGANLSSGFGGKLRYTNNISVTPGLSYTVKVGAGGVGRDVCFSKAPGSQSAFAGNPQAKGGGACCFCNVGTGFNGGGCGGAAGGGGGGGGYQATGGGGGGFNTDGAASTGGGGGGGAGGQGSAWTSGCCSGALDLSGGGGGGVGFLGVG